MHLSDNSHHQKDIVLSDSSVHLIEEERLGPDQRVVLEQVLSLITKVIS